MCYIMCMPERDIHMIKTHIDEKYFKDVCINANNMSEAGRTLGLHPSTFIRIAKRLGCYIPNQFNRPGYKPHGNSRQDVIDKYLSNRQCIAPSALRKQLIRHRIKEYKCEICGLSEWMGKPIPLELHHKDHNRYNNALDNLQILCPTCHAQTTNGCNSEIPQAVIKAPEGYEYSDNTTVPEHKNRPKSNNIKHKKNACSIVSKMCVVCGNEFTGPRSNMVGRKYCSYTCSHKASMRYSVNADHLLDMFRHTPNYTQVAKTLGVSDNAVKKRCKKLGIYNEVNEMIQKEKVARGVRMRKRQLSEVGK